MLRRIKDDRRTVQKFQSNNRIIDDSWRMAGSNVESTNRRNEFWTGETRFQVIPNEQWDRSMVEDTDSEDVGSTRSRVVTCTHGDQMDIIPLNDMFISHQYKLKNAKGKDHGWDIEVALHRKSGKKLVYHFQRSSCDILACLYRDHTAYLDLYEMKDETPCLLLMCAEEQSLFTKVHCKDRFKLLHIVTITENDNLLSPYGRAKWKRCLGTSSDCVFFAGPCTGGSPWNRLNKRVSEETASNIEWKAFLYWELWEEFADCLNHAIYINAMALLELPKGCDYWRDKRMTDMINGTDSHTHEFDGCMYGLKSKYNKIGTPIKKPWRIISWGVSFNKLHEKCDGSHAHGPCAGRETRITQLYTEQIVKIILKGVKNQMLLNNAYGIKRNFNPKMTSVCQALSCIRMYQDHTHHDDQVQQGFQFLHFLHCGSFRLKVQEWFPGLRPAPLPDPDSFWTVILATSAMASTSANMNENEVKTLTGVKATMRTITMLDVLRKRGVASQLPGRFTLSHEENGPITDVAVNKWLDSVKIPVVVVASLTFASRRRNLANVTHALQLLARTFRECTIRGELDMNAETYVGTASRMMKAFVSKFREGIEAQNLDLLCSPECANHAEDLWSVLKENYAVLIGGGKTVSDLYQLLTSSNVTELGALNTTHPPANSFVEQIRRGSLFLKTNQETWSKRPREITQRPDDDDITFMYEIIAEMKSELANVGYALRRHNAKHPDDRDRQIIIQDVIRDWIEFKYDLTIERAAAVTHLQTTVMLATILQSWERALDLFDPSRTVIFPMREALRKTFIQLTKALDIPEDIWAHGGYHIMLADNGAYQAVTDRNEALSHFRNYLTTMSDTQRGQGSSNAGHITGWEIPLMPRDDRPPLATDQYPIEMRNIPNIDLTGPSSSTTPKQKPMPKRPAPTETPKAKPRPTGTLPGTPKAKARPSPPGDAPPWVIPALPVGVIEVLFVNMDYAQTPVRTKHWRDQDNTSYVLSLMQGPAASSSSATAWGQYLRRVTVYACMCFGVVSTNMVTNDAECKIPEDEWLRMYHFITQKFDIAKSGSYLTVAGMMVMLNHHDVEVANASGVATIKKGLTNPLACEIVKEPYVHHEADELSAKFREGTTILITDLMYRVGTLQLTNDIGMGLLDMGWQISIFKIHECEGARPLEKLADAISKAKTLLQSKARVGDGSVTVHVWLSMQFAMEVKHPFVLLTGANFVENLAWELYYLDMEASRPIFVSLCPQSAFNCVEGRIERLVKEIEMKLKDKGVFVSTSSQMWRGMYSVSGHQFRITKKAFDADLGKGVIWSVIERQLFRQRVPTQ